MEANSSLGSSAKKRKNSNARNVIESGDRLSNLPTSILHHILSFLSSKYVIQTCVLSKRWRYLWTSTPNLDFDHSLFPFPHNNAKKNYFMNFVDKFLLLRDGSNIEKFRLKCGKSCDLDRVETWISFAARRNVEELETRIIGLLVSLPPCLFNCESMSVLKLNLSGSILQLPTSMHLPALKTMHLRWVKFYDDNLTAKLFSNCPVLENLILEDCNLERPKIFNFSAPQLKNLTILFQNLNSTRVCKIIVSAPKLVTFKYKGCFALDCSLENLSSLHKADINLRPWNPPLHFSNDDSVKRLIKMLAGLYNAEVVTLSLQALEILSAERSLLESQPSPLCSLKYLKVTTQSKQAALPIHVITYLLNCSPSAETVMEFLEEA